jgi:hypothetical protein
MQPPAPETPDAKAQAPQHAQHVEQDAKKVVEVAPEDDLEFNYVADEVCVVVRRDLAGLPIDLGGDDVPADDLYEAVLNEIGGQTETLLQPPSVGPSSGLLPRLRLTPRLLAPLARGAGSGHDSGAGASRTVVLPRRDDTQTALCFFSVPSDAGRGAARHEAPAGERLTGPELAETVGVLVAGINRQRDRFRPLEVGQGRWRILAATPNWLTSMQGDHTGGGPGSLPKAVTRDELRDVVQQVEQVEQREPREPYEDGRRWRFHFGDPAVEALVTAQRAAADRGEAAGGVVVAVLDTCPDRPAVERAAREHSDNWLLQDVDRNVVFGDQTARFARRVPFGHLRYYVPNWRAGARRWRDAYAATKGDREAIDRLREVDFAMPDHGLFVAGMIRDIAPTAEVHLIRVLDDTGVGDLATLVDTLRDLPDRLLSGANRGKRLVINLSLIVDVPQRERLLQLQAVAAGAQLPPRHRWLLDQVASYGDLEAGLFEAVAALAARKDVLVVAAAGNDALGPVPNPAPRPPASFGATLRSVISVASINSEGEPSDFSNRGNEAQNGTGVAAFGGEAHLDSPADSLPEIPDRPVVKGRMNAPVGVFSAPELPLEGGSNHTGWVTWAGTSFSTPIISALAATFWTENPSQTPAEVVARIDGVATDVEGQLNCKSIRTVQH